MAAPLHVKGLALGQGVPAVAVPIAAPDEATTMTQVREACEQGADIVEWRADFSDCQHDENALSARCALIRAQAGQVPLAQEGYLLAVKDDRPRGGTGE